MSLISRLSNAIVSAIARGTVTASQAGPRILVQVQLLNQEVKERLEHMLPYGRSALPLAGDAVVLTVGADRNHMLCIAVDNPATRINDLASGEFGDSDGASVVAYRGDRLEVSSTKPIEIHSDDVVYVYSASQVIIGSPGGTTYHLVDERMIALFNSHTHASDGAPPSQQMALGEQTTTTLIAS